MSQLSRISESIQKYFNQDLRDSLNFLDIYDPEIDEQNNIIMLISRYYDPRLIKLINNKPNLLEQIRKNILSGISKNYQEIKDINIDIGKNEEIIIKLIISPFELQQFPDIAIRSSVASNLSLNELDTFCITNKDICGHENFWIHLFINKYPSYNHKKLSNILGTDDID